MPGPAVISVDERETHVARLHEHHGKTLLAKAGVAIPRGHVARTPSEAAHAARDIGGRVVLKIQAWTTGRAAMGGVAFADTPDQAEAAAKKLLGMKVGAFPVDQVLVEEAVAIRDELFVSITVDDAARAPVMLLSLEGGTGIEERGAAVHRLPIDVRTGLDTAELRRLLAGSKIDQSLHEKLADAIERIAQLAKQVEARSLEVNPLVTTEDGRVIAADCRITVDDYAVFRHKDLGIAIAREYDRPPTALEKIAYDIEANDYRGTFYFIQMAGDFAKGDGYVGFHGAGGGGSMMSMDAILRQGYKLATFVDTSGNPPASKVYRAARIVLATGPIDGYFGSGSGVASQEQFHSARGLVKAFIEAHPRLDDVAEADQTGEHHADVLPGDEDLAREAADYALFEDDDISVKADPYDELETNDAP